MVSLAVWAWAHTTASESAVARVEAERARIIGGYGDNFDYNGTKTQYTRGEAKGEFEDETDTGYIEAWIKVPEGVYPEGAGTYRIVAKNWEEAPNATWMDGGIASCLTLHGATGRGAPVLPEVFAYISGWGKADVYKDDELIYEGLEFHFMVTNGARDPETHAVHNSTRTGFWSPTDPENAYIHRYDIVLHVIAQSLEPDPKNFPPYTVFFNWNFEDVTLHMMG